ncbi:type IV toxin-antitoxin system AbiEi family antitoxin domain-containing protein [uncultured Treponema sp.]|uniref:type IV toxin-antitoxin system AbiEi family antitoxin domain-containing protein n=1 Tax=uncultured Treponema sp. TaxID=162155 RepID=UPI0025918181|nr:type IV toxin-antitoxin system AbiEi family antitoxin domain-containing protein [uncultured Treponema sp.]
MELNKEILATLQAGNNIISSKQVQELGFSKNLLSIYVREGLLVRIRQGFYTLPDSIEDDMYTLSLSSPKIVFSHQSALYLNGISDRTPFEHIITMPSDTRIPSSLKGKCICHYVKPELYNFGLEQRKTIFGNTVNCYNSERTICNLVRSRSQIDEETFLAGIKNYAQSKNKDLRLLGSYADKFHVLPKVRDFLGVLV